MLARWGGEEFALLLPHGDLAAAEVVARRMVGAMRAEGLAPLGGERVTISVGVGVAVVGPAETTSARALERADEALDGEPDRAKRQGRDRVVVAGGALVAGGA